MSHPVRLVSIGIARTDGDGAGENGGLAGRLSGALSVVSREGAQVRLAHRIEEATLIAAYDALRLAGVRTPLGTEEIGVALGVEEGIDGIKAQYYREVATEGPLGASPIVFPLTTPNTLAARISIALDLRGESVTLCGGTLSGAHALGRAMEALREGRSSAMLTGGATSVEREFLDALSLIGGIEGGVPGCAACLFLLRAQGSADAGSIAGQILGYSEAVGAHEVRDAVEACLQDAALAPSQVRSVCVASALDPRVLVEAIWGVGVEAPMLRSPSAWWHSASFPLAVAEAIGQATDGPREPTLVVGSDCLVGAAAAVVRGGGC
jgi:hypothetical protein